MSMRMALALASLAAVVAVVVWLATRGGEPVSPVQAPLAVTENSPAPGTSAVATAANPPATVATSPALTAPTRVAQAALPIEVTAGFETLNTPLAGMKETDGARHLVVFHNKLQSEPRDESWAPRIEEMLTKGIRDSLTSRGFDDQRIDLRVVECRTSGCEIQAAGFNEDNGKPDVDLQLIVARMMVTGGWGNEFDQNLVMYVGEGPEDRIGFLVFLTRKSP